MHAHVHGADVVGHACKLGGSPRVVKRKARRRNGDVVVDRPAEQLLALQHHADVAAQRPRVQTCQVAPVVAHGAALRNLEARRGKLFCGSFFCGVCGGLLDHGVLLGYGAFLDFSRLVGFGILLVGKFGHNGAFLGNLCSTRFVDETPPAIRAVPVCRVALGLGCGGLGLNLPQAVSVVGRVKLAVFGAAHSAHRVAGARGRTAAVAVAYDGSLGAVQGAQHRNRAVVDEYAGRRNGQGRACGNGEGFAHINRNLIGDDGVPENRALLADEHDAVGAPLNSVARRRIHQRALDLGLHVAGDAVNIR
ncbi:hypothetical protein [uncultured Senegalimassilia sp.]|uniref:hypothetical protein n=1 Tax=uncultured Senegalimassilia sp. TaxID=1714350 RepID=UPI00338F343F